MNIRLIPVVLSFVPTFFIHSALASHIEVVNENKKSLTVKIKAEGMDTDDATYVQEIPAEQHSKFSIDKSSIKEKSFFSIKGSTSPFTPGDKCNLLNVEKNYKVTFLNDKVGTTCVAEEIK